MVLKSDFMLNRSFQIVLSLFFVFIVASCGTLSTMNIDVLRPAGYSVAPDIISVVVVDNSLPFRDDSVHLIGSFYKESFVDTVWVDNFGKIATKSMFESLNEKNFYDSVYYHSIPLNRNLSNPNLGEIPLPLIDSLCKAYNAQALISLEAFRYKSDTRIAEMDDFLYVSMDVNSLLYWKIYRNDGILLDANIQKDSIFWDNTQSSYSYAHSKIPTIRESVEILAWHMGNNASKRVAPYWESVKRNFYKSGSLFFTKANELVIKNKWEEAARIWYYVYENSKNRQKAMAAFNLALSYEVRGDFAEALAWSDISRQLFEKLGSMGASEDEKKMSRLYYIEIAERYQQIRKLNEQLGTIQ